MMKMEREQHGLTSTPRDEMSVLRGNAISSTAGGKLKPKAKGTTQPSEDPALCNFSIHWT